MKIIFFGTPEYAVLVLQELVKIYEILAVVTNPQSPVGTLSVPVTPLSGVEKFAKSHKIEVLSSQKLSEHKPKIKSLKPDLGVVAAFGKIIPKDILEIPKFGFLNVHSSLLPKFRGPSPVQYAILEGEKETGVTIIKIDERVDHGPILATEKEKILNNDTTRTLSERLFKHGGKLLVKIIPDYISGKIKLLSQKHQKATFTKLVRKEDGLLNPKDSSQLLERKTRAFHPWPTLYTFLDNNRVIIHQAHLKNGKFVPDLVQVEGKKPISYEDFVRGYHKELKF